MISQKEQNHSEFIELTNELKVLKFQVGNNWKNFFVDNEEFKKERDELIAFYKEQPSVEKAEVLFYLDILDLAEPKATHVDLFDPSKINI